MAVVIDGVEQGSIAARLGIKPKDVLLRINDNKINDVLDYLYYTVNESIKLEIKTRKKDRFYRIQKEEHQDIGLVFDDFLMDKQRSCQNNCIFCFIDQLPKGMRRGVYAKDDDERLSFLFGNYLTLTNLDEALITRLIEMRVSPINISVHSTEPKLLEFMLGNSNAAGSIAKIHRLAEAGIHINCQIVLCRNINDKQNLIKTLNDLVSLYPSVQSISVVPVGLTSFRQNLTVLEPFDKDDSIETLRIVHEIQTKCRQRYNTGLVYAADEWYIAAGIGMPELTEYDDLYQIENGVGMLAQFETEFIDALMQCEEISVLGMEIITGEIAYSWLSDLLAKAKDRFPDMQYTVHGIKNEYFGGNVGVSGLVTASDIMNQVKKEEIRGECILIPRNMLRSEGDMFLDDITTVQLQAHYERDVVVISDGYELMEAFKGLER